MQDLFKLNDIIYRNVLHIPSLRISSNIIFAINGQSGSGKTTLLKLLNNMVTPDQGEICYYGHNLLNLDPVTLRRRMIMVPQNPFIFPGSVRDNINLAFNYNRQSLPAQKEIESIMALLNLPANLNRNTFNLSGGEKQRLALLRAMLLDPETLLLDEPTAALDEENAAEIISYLARWSSKPGKTVLMVSHSLPLVTVHADSILYLSGGKIAKLEESRLANERSSHH